MSEWFCMCSRAGVIATAELRHCTLPAGHDGHHECGGERLWGVGGWGAEEAADFRREQRSLEEEAPAGDDERKAALVDGEAGTLLAALRERYPESPITLAYHPDADPGDGSGWAVEVGDRTWCGDLVEAMRRHLRPTGVIRG